VEVNHRMLSQLIKNSRLTDSWSQSIKPKAYSDLIDPALSPELMQRAIDTVTSWPGYEPTPAHSLGPIAKACGVASVVYKDESGRFGLGSFKALGGAFAILDWAANTLSEQLGKPVTIESVRRGDHKELMKNLTVATATDGNHGRSVAWGASLAGCPCQIFIHRDVSVGREKAMAEFGATVNRIDGDYDESVRQCATESDANNWQIISDTSWPGYTDIPRSVMAGYTVMVDEMMQQLDQPPTHVWWERLGTSAPVFIVVESDRADCVYQSLRNGSTTAVDIKTETLMAGLSCGEVSQLAWPVLQQGVSAVITIPDDGVASMMQCFAKGDVADTAIEAGECGVPGVLALAAIVKDKALSNTLGIDDQSRIQVFGCEWKCSPPHASHEVAFSF